MRTAKQVHDEATWFDAKQKSASMSDTPLREPVRSIVLTRVLPKFMTFSSASLHVCQIHLEYFDQVCSSAKARFFARRISSLAELRRKRMSRYLFCTSQIGGWFLVLARWMWVLKNDFKVLPFVVIRYRTCNKFSVAVSAYSIRRSLISDLSKSYRYFWIRHEQKECLTKIKGMKYLTNNGMNSFPVKENRKKDTRKKFYVYNSTIPH